MKLYVMEAANGLVKVGVSRQPNERRLQLQRESGLELNIIYLSEELDRLDAFTFEKYCFFALDDHHYQGEWFKVSGEEAVSIVESALNDGACTRKIQPVRLDTIKVDIPKRLWYPNSLAEIVERGYALATH